MSKFMDTLSSRWGSFTGVTKSPAARRRLLPRGAKGKDFWDQQFAAVTEHLEEWGYEVELGTGYQDRVLLGEHKTVQINSVNHPETKFYTLLHELGHILVRRRWKEFSDRHPNYLDHPDAPVDGRRKRSIAYRVGLIGEEMEAWRRGKSWAERHGFFVDPFKYDDERNRALLSYIGWAADITGKQYQGARAAAATRARRPKARKKGNNYKGSRRSKK